MNFKNKKRSKGIVDIEFMVSIIVFLTVLTYVTFAVINLLPRLHQESFDQDIKSKVFQISELLMFNEGEPADWQTKPLLDDVKRFGFSSGGNYSMDVSKITKFDQYCSANYAKVKDLLGLDYTNDILVDIKIVGNGAISQCHPLAISTVRTVTTIVRLGLDSSNSNNVIEMTVSIM
jgi:hypothetical protein